ncbi:ROK family protein [Maribellus comscasis]|uniref:ROK family protein n=1 Tax=Maribellus comscasis TaxID=2681766 RepID=A0A6I6JLY5_9BACT|nr:ROK family protein [Maribellus comscasis]QGY42229.1 ROK family protein [Maribellus comscasis]
MEKLLCGVDIGGTKCAIALVNTEGKIIDKINTCAHVNLNEDGLVKLVAEQIKELIQRNQLQETDLQGIGMGCAGHIRFRDGVIITTSNLKGFKNYPLRDAMQKYFKIPVILDNDANAQAFGAYKFGAGKGYDDMVFLTISTGIGAGIVINKKLFRGATGTAGEVGHTIVEPHTELTCTCGNKGCLMAMACGMALPFLYQKKIKEGKKSKLNIPPHFDISKLSGQYLKKGLDMDDPVSKEIISDSAYYVGLGIYNIFQTLNPPLIVLGGGLTNWGDFYLGKIKATFYELARDMIFDPIKIVISNIGADAGVIGAAALTLE